MVWSENFRFKPFPDSRAKRERERSHPKRDRTQSPEPFDFAPFDFAGKPRALQLRTLRLCCLTSTSNHTLRLRQQTQSPNHAFDFAKIAPQDRTETAPIAPITLRSQLRNCWVLMNLTGFDNFFFVGFCFCVYLLRNGIIYLFGNWENVRNKKKMCFLYYF